MTMASQTTGSPAELSALIALAQREHHAGRLAEAAAACRQILALRPDIADAHNHLGIILAQQDLLEQAQARFEQAIALRPGYTEAHNNLGNVLLGRGKLDDAAARYEQALTLKPDFTEAHNNLGNVLLSLGKLGQAAAEFEQAIAFKPDYAEAHNNLGNALWKQGKLDEALARFEKALALKPDYAEAHSNLGNILWKQGKLDQAAATFEQALALRPNYAEAHNNLGIVLAQQDKFDLARSRFEHALALRPDYAEACNNLANVLLSQGKLDQAVVRYEQALVIRPNYTEVLSNLGNILWKQGKLDEAAASSERALALRPDYAEAHNNLGNVLLSRGKLDEATKRFEQALALRPDYAEAHNNLGDALNQQGKVDQAQARFEQALALRPDLAEAQLGLATCLLVNGDYERGWPAYEARLRRPGHLPQLNLPRWSGEPLAGRSLLLLAEQGLGDTIHFVRYARLLKERGARIVLAAQAPLGRLLAPHPDRHRSDWDELFILGSSTELPRVDFYLPLASAPGAFRTTASTIPCEVPYLWADPELTDRWRAELAGTGGFKIGIVWQGSRSYSLDRWRSIPLADFGPLARLPGVRLVSLQKGFGSEQVAAVDFPVLDISGRLDDVAGPFMDTAAVLCNLDLVVTPDTAIAHLAGALGVRVWLALPHSADWRWQRAGDDSPWYPTMRLFRQTTLGKWHDVFERIANAAAARCSETA
jgi:Tfp pilus assembly protein PilF